MRAYNLAMATIFINAGIYVVGLLGMFGDMGGVSNSFMDIFNGFSVPILSIGGFEIRGIDAIAIALAGGTIVFLNSNAVNDRGIAYLAFTAIFWGSFFIASDNILSIEYEGVYTIYMVYFLASVMIFIMAFIQMPTGGQKSHV